jgi:type VI secretion system protein ImpJ
MRPPQRVVWSEGMLISPQHLQQQDRYHEALLSERLRAYSPHAWGVVEMALDERALERGQIAVQSFFGIFPDGSVAQFEPGHPEAPAARALEGHFPAHSQALEVFLGIPREPSAGGYARGPGDAKRARYTVETRAILDAVGAGDAESVDFARRNFALLFGDESRDDLECLKVAEVVREAAGRMTFAGPFIPPSLRVGASAFLADGVRRVLTAAVAKRREVAADRRQRDRSSVEYSADDVSRYLALHALSGAIPALQDIVESGDASPYHAYSLLVQLAGQLTAFSADEDPTNLPRYFHTEPRLTFEPLFAKLLSLLRVAVAARTITIALEARSDGTHLGRLLDPQLFTTGVRFLLSVQAALPEHQIYGLLPRVAKVASWQDIPRLVNAATSGVPLHPSPRPPREVAVRAGKTYFALQDDHAAFQGVLSQRAIAVYLPPPFDAKTTQVELLAIPQE